MIVNTRELANQIHDVYEKITRGTGISLANFNFDSKPKQICVSTHGKIEAMMKDRKKIDLTTLKCLVVDEADVFFLDDKNFDCMKSIANYKDIKNRPENDKV